MSDHSGPTRLQLAAWQILYFALAIAAGVELIRGDASTALGCAVMALVMTAMHCGDQIVVPAIEFDDDEENP